MSSDSKLDDDDDPWVEVVHPKDDEDDEYVRVERSKSNQMSSSWVRCRDIEPSKLSTRQTTPVFGATPAERKVHREDNTFHGVRGLGYLMNDDDIANFAYEDFQELLRERIYLRGPYYTPRCLRLVTVGRTSHRRRSHRRRLLHRRHRRNHRRLQRRNHTRR